MSNQPNGYPKPPEAVSGNQEPVEPPALPPPDWPRPSRPARPCRFCRLFTALLFVLALAILGAGHLGWWRSLFEQPLRGELIASTWSEGEAGHKRGLRIGVDPLAVPLGPDERLHLEVRLNQPAFVYLIWLHDQGIATPLYPWNRDQIHVTTLSAPPDQKPLAVVHNPSRPTEGWRPYPSGGIDTVLLLVRKTPLPADVALSALLGSVPPTGSGQPGEVVMRGLNQGQPANEAACDLNRGPGREAQKTEERLLRIMEPLKDHFELIRVLQFTGVTSGK